MKKFLFKIIVFFIPFMVITVLYFILDPFKVLYTYNSYFDSSVNGVVFLNTDYVSTKNFDNHYDEFRYNSFIFGNSRAWFYQLSDWKKHIGKESAYHFETAGEALYSIHKKVLYLDKKGVDIKNALLVLDHEILVQDGPKDGHLGIIAPQLVKNQNLLSFHIASLKGFFNIEFLFAYFDFTISGKVKAYMMRHKLLDHRPFTYDYKSNELKYVHYEKLILRNEYYTEERMKVFFDRDSIPSITTVSISENQKLMLGDILTVFEKHETNFKIIISPLYNQKKLAHEDLIYLKSLFGGQNVFDFSGKNSFTEDYQNYYESSHYRPHVAEKMLEIVYRNDNLRASKK
jgi:hypothetical protein